MTPETDAYLNDQEELEIGAFLRSLPLLADLSDMQIASLGAACLLQTYTAGEFPVRQGDNGDSLFFIKSGQVDVLGEHEAGVVHIKTLEAGDFFGEMSLLTGEPRTATIRARSETDTVVIEKEHFIEVLTAHPAILDLLLYALELRGKDLEERMANATTTEQAPIQEQLNLLKRITTFLGLSS